MNGQITAALIGGAATLLTGAGAVWAVVWQIGKQSRLAIEQNAHNARIALKLEVYRNIAEECEAQQESMSPLLGKLTALRWRVPSLFTKSRYKLSIGMTVPEFVELVSKVQRGAADLLILIERWEILDPRLDLFRDAINSAAFNMRTAWDEIMPLIHETLPASSEEQGTWSAHPEVANDLLELVPKLESGLYELNNFMHDLRLEMQNLLLSDLFETRVTTRIPIDPDVVAIRLDRYEELKEHFKKCTAWGRHVEQVYAEVRHRVASRQTA